MTRRTDAAAPVSRRRFRSAIVRALESRASYRTRASSVTCESRYDAALLHVLSLYFERT